MYKTNIRLVHCIKINYFGKWEQYNKYFKIYRNKKLQSGSRCFKAEATLGWLHVGRGGFKRGQNGNTYFINALLYILGWLG